MTSGIGQVGAYGREDVEALIGEVAHLRGQLANLEHALESRDVVGMAKGILMARQRCGPDEAFAMLAQASQRENRKVIHIAQRIVEQNATRRRRGC